MSGGVRVCCRVYERDIVCVSCGQVLGIGRRSVQRVCGRSVWRDNGVEQCQLQWKLYRGICVSRWLHQRHRRAVSTGSVVGSGVSRVHCVWRRTVRRDVWVDELQLQWTVRRGILRHDGSDDVELQWCV